MSYKQADIYIVYRVFCQSSEERVILVTDDEAEAVKVASSKARYDCWTVEWEVIPLCANFRCELGRGAFIYVLSDGGPSDEAKQEISPIALRAFTSKSEALEALSEAAADPAQPDPRLRTFKLGQRLEESP